MGAGYLRFLKEKVRLTTHKINKDEGCSRAVAELRQVQ
jgi:hypothetical protein